MLCADQLSLTDALARCVENSSLACWVAEDGDEPVAVWGLANWNKDVGIPWLLLAASARQRFRRELTRDSRRYLQRMLEIRPQLMNVVHMHNSVAIRWLRSLGFDVHRDTMELRGHRLHLFTYNIPYV